MELIRATLSVVGSEGVDEQAVAGPYLESGQMTVKALGSGLLTPISCE